MHSPGRLRSYETNEESRNERAMEGGQVKSKFEKGSLTNSGSWDCSGRSAVAAETNASAMQTQNWS